MCRTKNELPKVAVLMSTYNGEKYLREQIESILNQKNVLVHLFIRDDGSTDGTKRILVDYQGLGNVHVDYSENIGCGESFWQLMCTCSGFDYYAFSDQDDVWLEDKLVRAIRIINERADKGKPTLYCANFWLVDEKLRELEQERIFGLGKLGKDNLIVTNLRACGNSMVWTDELHRIIVSKNNKRNIKITFHDLWVEFFAAMVGDIIIDEKRVLLYRQHRENTSGGSYISNKSSWIKKRLKYIAENRLFGTYEKRHYDELRAKYCLENYTEYLSDERIEALAKVINYRKSVKDTIVLLGSSVCKNTPFKVKVRVLMHRI